MKIDEDYVSIVLNMEIMC